MAKCLCAPHNARTLPKVPRLVFWVNLGTIDSRPCVAAAPSPSQPYGMPLTVVGLATASYTPPNTYYPYPRLSAAYNACIFFLTGYEPRLSG